MLRKIIGIKLLAVAGTVPEGFEKHSEGMVQAFK